MTLTRTDSAWVFFANKGGLNFGNSQIIYSAITEYIEPSFLEENYSQDFISYDQSPAGILGALYNDGSGSFSYLVIYATTEPISEPDVGDVNGDI